jgi:hypothetical protein
MNYRKLELGGRPGRRIREALVAGCFLVCTCAASRFLRDPTWDGWLDAYNWPQLFLMPPMFFFLGVTVWQSISFAAEWFYREAKRETENVGPEALRNDPQRTLRFWLRDSRSIGMVYITSCVIGDLPMAINYLAEVRGTPLHWWWSNAVATCLLLIIGAWWMVRRIQFEE